MAVTTQLGPQLTTTFNPRSRDSIIHAALERAKVAARARREAYEENARRDREARIQQHREIIKKTRDIYEKNVGAQFRNIVRYNGSFKDADGDTLTYRGGQVVTREHPDGSAAFYDSGVLVRYTIASGITFTYVDGAVSALTHANGVTDIVKDGVVTARRYPDGIEIIYQEDQSIELHSPNGLVEHWKEGVRQDQILPDGTAYLFSNGVIDHIEHPDGSVTRFEDNEHYFVERANGDVETYSQGQLATITYKNTGICFSFEQGVTTGKTYPNGMTETWENGQLATRTLPDGTVESWENWELVSRDDEPDDDLSAQQRADIETQIRIQNELDNYGITSEELAEAQADLAWEESYMASMSSSVRDLTVEDVFEDAIVTQEESHSFVAPIPEHPTVPEIAAGLVQPSLDSLEAEVRSLKKTLELGKDPVRLAENDLLDAMCRDRTLLAQVPEAERPSLHEQLSEHEAQYAALTGKANDTLVRAHVIRESQLAHANDDERLRESIARLASRKGELFQYAYSEPHPWVAEIEDAGEAGLLRMAEYRQRWDIHDEADPFGQWVISDEQERERAAIEELLLGASLDRVGGLLR